MKNTVRRAREFNFFTLENELIDSNNFKSVTEFAVYICLCRFANTNEGCFPSVSRIANSIKVSPKTARRALHDMAERGLLVKEERFSDNVQQSNLYFLMDATDEGGTPTVGGGYGNSGRGVLPQLPTDKNQEKKTKEKDICDEVWSLFPKESRTRSSKKQVRDAWKRVSQKPDIDQLKEKIAAWCLCKDWQTGFAQGAHIWIKNEKWDGETPEPFEQQDNTPEWKKNQVSGGASIPFQRNDKADDYIL